MSYCPHTTINSGYIRIDISAEFFCHRAFYFNTFKRSEKVLRSISARRYPTAAPIAAVLNPPTAPASMPPSFYARDHTPCAFPPLPTLCLREYSRERENAACPFHPSPTRPYTSSPCGSQSALTYLKASLKTLLPSSFCRRISEPPIR